MKSIKQSENEVKKAIKDYLELNGWKVRRINNAGIFRGYNKQGDKRFSFDGDPGVSDLHCTKSEEDRKCVNSQVGSSPQMAKMQYILRIRI